MPDIFTGNVEKIGENNFCVYFYFVQLVNFTLKRPECCTNDLPSKYEKLGGK